MNKLNVVTAVAVIMTTLVLYGLGTTPFIPAWAVFISWACFFHMEGGANPNAAFMATFRHVGLGIVAAWLSALLVLNNPFGSALVSEWWTPVIIGLMIGLLSWMSIFAKFAITPAIIYGYAGSFAFLSIPGRFDTATLLALSFENVLVALGASLLIGVFMGYLNAGVVQWLSALSLRKS